MDPNPTNQIYFIYSVNETNKKNKIKEILYCPISNQKIPMQFEKIATVTVEIDQQTLYMYFTPLIIQKEKCSFKLITQQNSVYTSAMYCFDKSTNYFIYSISFGHLSDKEMIHTFHDHYKFTHMQEFNYFVNYFRNKQLETTVLFDELIMQTLPLYKAATSIESFDFFENILVNVNKKNNILNEVLNSFVYPQVLPPKENVIKNLDNILKNIYASRNELPTTTPSLAQSNLELLFCMFFFTYDSSFILDGIRNFPQYQPLATCALKLLQDKETQFTIFNENELNVLWDIQFTIKPPDLKDIEHFIRIGTNSKDILNFIKSKSDAIIECSKLSNRNIKIEAFPPIIDKDECCNYFYLIAFALENAYDISIQYLFKSSDTFKSSNDIDGEKMIYDLSYHINRYYNNSSMKQIEINAMKYYHYLNETLLDPKLSTNQAKIFYISQPEDKKKFSKIIQLMSYFDFNQITDEFRKTFEETNFELHLGNMYMDAMTKFINSSSSLSQYNEMVSLFPQPIHKSDLLKKLDEKFFDLLHNDFGLYTFHSIKNTASSLMTIFIKNKFKSDFLTKLSENMIKEYSIKLFLHFINEFEPDISATNISSMLSHIISNTSYENIAETITTIHPKKALILLFEKSLNSFIVKENDFFSKDSTINWVIFQNFVIANYFTEEYAFLMKTNYHILVNQNIKKIYDSIINKAIMYSRWVMISLMTKEELRKKICTLCLKDESMINSLVIIIDELCAKYSEIVVHYPSVLQYLKTFFKGRSEDIRALLYFESTYLKKMPVKDILNQSNAISIIQRNIQDAYKYNVLTQSRIWKSIYDSNQLKNEIEKRDESFKKFNRLIVLFEYDGYKTITNEQYKIIFEVIGSKNLIEQEMLFLAKYFNKENININLLIETIFFLSKKEELVRAIEELLAFFNIMKAEKTQLYIDCKNLYDKSCRGYDYDFLKEIFNTLEHYEIKVEDTTQNICFIIHLLVDKRDFLQFLWGLDEHQMRFLVEFVDEANEAMLKASNIDELSRVIVFVKDLKGSKGNRTTDIEYIKAIKDLLYEPKHDKMHYLLQSVYNHFEGIKELKSKTTGKQEFIRKQISDISSKALIVIQLINEQYNVSINYQAKLDKVIYLDEFIELKDRSLLLLNKKRDLQLNESFHIFADKILLLLKYINELSNKGYPFTFNYTINVKDQKAILNNTTNIEEELIRLKNELAIINEIQLQEYRTNHLLTFVFGKHFQIIFLYLSTFKDSDAKRLKHFFNYITDGKFEKYPSKRITNVVNETKDSISLVSAFVISALAENQIHLENVYPNNIIKPNLNKQYAGIYTVLSSEKEIPKDVVSSYITLCEKAPLPHTVFLCNDSTSNEEIIAFCYRVFTCPFNVLFSLIKAEKLPLDKRELILNQITQCTVKKNYKMVSALFVYYDNKAADLINQIKKFQLTHQELMKDIPYEDIRPYFPTIEVISSDACGVGKSFHIENKANPLPYIYFPVGGTFDLNQIRQRLLESTIDFKTNAVLHLDLFDSKRKNEMSDFLFSFLILKTCSINHNLYFTSRELTIKIEIPFGFIDFIEKFPILKLFNQFKLEIRKLPLLVIPSEPKSNIQLVVNYILSINTIHKGPVEFKVYPENKCRSTIKESFKNELPNYYQIIAYINCFGNQLRYFDENIYLSSEQLNFIGKSKKLKDLTMIRPFIVRSYNAITQYFTKGDYRKLLENQDVTYRSQTSEYNENEANKKAIELLVDNANVIKFDDINPSLIVHNDDGQTLSIISTINETDLQDPSIDKVEKEKKGQEYQKLIQLRNSGEMAKEKLPLVDYKRLNHKQFLLEVKKLLNFNDVLYTKDKPYGMNKKSLEEIVGSYVFTSDNYIKMVLIILRMRAQIPVILMGETGCGKTSLINKLAEIKKINMKVLNIHAGISDEDIVEFINGQVIPNYTQGQPSWVFFDEINTCDSMGLISEIMCKKTMFGVRLPQELTFIAACNPYKLKKVTNTPHIGLVNKDSDMSISQLVYAVIPLPHSLLNFVFNFGNVSQKDEEKYIASIIKRIIETTFQIKPRKHSQSQNEEKGESDLKEEKSQSDSDGQFYSVRMKEINQIDPTCIEDSYQKEIIKRLTALVAQIIVFSQNFIRCINDISSVSLRDIRRFEVFYKWFYDYLSNKAKATQAYKASKIKSEMHSTCIYAYDYSVLTQEDLILQAVILSIYICYYLRIHNKQEKKSFSDHMDWKLEMSFLDITEREENELINLVGIPPGIAKNPALLRNLFTLFVCVNTRVPLFICGKPGCSKSLSVQLLFKAMRGPSSDNDFFKSYPRLYMNCFQGSLSSTSKGVTHIFDKAQSLITHDKTNRELISMVFFDEMGLAEKSSNNPLKVIHSRLEYDEHKEKVAFVGISNWTLDASKMNRGVFISITDPDENDLIKTASTIAESFDKQLTLNYSSLFEKLAKVYYEYKQRLTEIDQLKKREFHGTRDFYYLIKTISKKLQQSTQLSFEETDAIAVKSIERNFGGLDFSISLIKKIFVELFPLSSSCKEEKEYDVMSCIKDSIMEENSRYLLLVSKSSLSPFLIRYILEKDVEQKKYFFFLGSQFEKDINDEFYCVKSINKIQSIMEQGNIVVLKNLEIVYPSLYDLFNQNFSVISNKNYARIAVGSANNLLSEVNDTFYCIILVDQNELNNQDPPFLNRFEKHIVLFEYLLDKTLIKYSNNISIALMDVIKPPVGKQIKVKYDLGKQMINCDIEEIQGILFENNRISKIKTENEAFSLVLRKIAPTLSQDVITFAHHSKFKIKYPKAFELLVYYYKEYEHRSIKCLIKNMKELKQIVYTFSSILDTIVVDTIDKPSIVYNKLLGLIKTNEIYEILLSKATSEKELESLIDSYYKNPQLKICIIKFAMNDLLHLNHFNFLLESYENEITIPKKAFVIIIYLIRDFSSSNKDQKKESETLTLPLISHLSSFEQTFIDNLNGADMLITEILNMTTNQMYYNSFLFNYDSFIRDNIFHIYSQFTFTMINNDTPHYHKLEIKKLNSNTVIKRNFLDTIMKHISKEQNIPLNLLIKQDGISKNDVDLISTLINYLKTLFLTSFQRLIYKCENDNILNSMLYSQLDDNSHFWKLYLDSLKLDPNKGNEIKIYTEMELIVSKIILNKLIVDAEQYTINYYNNEDYTRKGGDDEENDDDTHANYNWDLVNQEKENKRNEKLILKYKNEEKKIVNGFYLTFEENKWLQIFIEKYNKKELKKETLNSLYNDYYNKFIVDNFLMSHKQLIECLSLMVSLRFDFQSQTNSNNVFIDFAQKTLWIQSNTFIIKIILQSFLEISEHKTNLLYKINDVIKSKVIQYEINERSPIYRKEINEVFFLMIESMLIIAVGLSKDSFVYYEENKYFNYIKTLKRFIQNCDQIELNLIFISKEKTFVEFLIELNKSNIKSQKDRKDIMIKLIELNNKEREAQSRINSMQEIEQLLTNEFTYIKTIVTYHSEVADVMINYLLGKYMKYYNQNYRMKILQLLLKSPNLVQKSFKLIKMYFFNYDIEPEYNSSFNMSLLNQFVGFIDKKDEILQLLNSDKSQVLREIMCFLFQTTINNYFVNLIADREQIQDPKDVLLNMNIEYFNKSIIFLDNCFNKQSTYLYSYLGCLYVISYIKVYTFHFVEITLKSSKPGEIITPVINTINGLSERISNVIKIYFLKMIMQKASCYEDFVFLAKKKFPSIVQEYNLVEQSKSRFDYFFMQISQKQKFEDCSKKFLVYFKDIFKIEGNEGEGYNIINDMGLFMFYDTTVNTLLSNISKEGFIETFEYQAFSEWAVKQINSSSIKQETKNLMRLIYDKGLLKAKFIPVIKNAKPEELEMLLYCFKLCMMITEANDNCFYKRLFSNGCSNELEKNFFPGGETSENIFIQSCEEIKIFLEEKNNPSHGAYICSCGRWYAIEPCGLPANPRDLPLPKCVCDLFISGFGHVLYDRPGHIRIYKDEAQRFNVENRSYYPKDRPVPYKMMKHFEQDIQTLINNQSKGMRSVTEHFFLRRNKTIRKLDQITYRFLNVILYSIFYYGIILGYISSGNLANFSVEKLTIYQILQKTWEKLKEELQTKNISSIQIFMNQTYESVQSLISSCPYPLGLSSSRDIFEDCAIQFISSIVKNHKTYSQEYINENNQQLQINQFSMRSLLQESVDPNLLSQEEFPYLRYFFIEKYPTVDLIEKDFQLNPTQKIKYPVIANYIEKREKMILMKNLLLINPFCNYMINQYSYQISRDEAKTLLIETILDDTNRGLFERFKTGWNEIKAEAIKYKCRPEMPVKEIDENEPIAYCLNDDGDLLFGMYIASAYQNFIENQNSFLKSIIEKVNRTSDFFAEPISKAMKIQEATQKEVLTLEFNTPYYKSFEDIIASYTYKDCFDDKFNILYANYKSITIDLDKIEDELGKVLLPGKRLFLETQKFVTFAFEGYHGEKSAVIADFIKKYKQTPISFKQKKAIGGYAKLTKSMDKVLFSIQMLIFYLKNENEKSSTSLKTIIDTIPDYINLTKEFLEFFNIKSTTISNKANENEEFNIEHLLDLNDYVEMLCYDIILENVNVDYKKQLPEVSIVVINNYFAQNYEGRLVTKEVLHDATRKFISRYLSGKRSDNDIKIENKIIEYIMYKEELWPSDIFNNESFEEECYGMLGAMNDVFVCHSVSLVSLLLSKSIELSNQLQSKPIEDEQINTSITKPLKTIMKKIEEEI